MPGFVKKVTIKACFCQVLTILHRRCIMVVTLFFFRKEKHMIKTRKDFQGYKWMNTGSGVYRKNISSEKLNSSCLIWLGIIAVVGIIFLVA